MQYSKEQAEAYAQLGIANTTYQAGFRAIEHQLGDLSGKVALDYGSGAGRSTLFIDRVSHPKEITDVDIDANMINSAQAYATENIQFEQIQKIDPIQIPLPDQSVDVVVSTSVFMEIRTKQEMLDVTKELARVLKSGGIFILNSINPDSIGHEYVSYTYLKEDNLKSGDPITCIMKGDMPFKIEDTYWTENDYVETMKAAGFTQITVSYPIETEPGPQTGWLSETIIPSDILIIGRKAEGIFS